MGEIKTRSFGLGLRSSHYAHVLAAPAVQAEWFEVISENFMGLGRVPSGRPLETLLRIRERYPIVMHGVSMSLGGTDPLDADYLKTLSSMINVVQPAWVSDHLCWTGVHGKQLHDLLPLPYTEETLRHVVARIQYVQDFLRRPLVLENVSSYLAYSFSEMDEAEFLSQICARSGARLLLDVNNVYVSSVNHGFSAEDFVKRLPAEAVAQIHLAGHSEAGAYLIDTHDAPVCAAVWALYEKTLALLGRPVPTMIERDEAIPEFVELEKELVHARDLSQKVFAALPTGNSKPIGAALHGSARSPEPSFG